MFGKMDSSRDERKYYVMKLYSVFKERERNCRESHEPSDLIEKLPI